MREIIETGITASVGAIERNICEKNGWYFDLLESGNWVVSKLNTKIGLFSDCEEAVFFFTAKADPLPTLTDEEELEAMDWLEQQLDAATIKLEES